ncbi:Trank1 [Symbiodinium sp. KB8]|nr:Trank1 [Symbiodinium sp. KB8]
MHGNFLLGVVEDLKDGTALAASAQRQSEAELVPANGSVSDRPLAAAEKDQPVNPSGGLEESSGVLTQGQRSDFAGMEQAFVRHSGAVDWTKMVGNEDLYKHRQQRLEIVCGFMVLIRSGRSDQGVWTCRQSERKQHKKKAKQAKESLAKDVGEKVKQEHLLSLLEAEHIVDMSQTLEERSEDPEPLPAPTPAPPPSEADETASIVSATTNTSRTQGCIRFEETVPELETVQEDEGESERRRALEEMFEKHVWYVTFTDEAFVELRRLVRSQQKAVLDVFTALASGKWPEEHCVKLNDTGYQRLKRASGGQQHILWSLDMQYVRAQKAFVEVIKIWHVLGEEDSQQAADTLIEEWKRSARSFEGIKRALQKKKGHEENGIRYPRTVMRSELQDSDVFSLRKFYTLDWRTMRSLLMEDAEGGHLGAGEQFLLNTSEQEDAIIEKKGPMIVIGRSGSGKTLCCAYRMWYRWVDYWKKSNEADGAALLPSGKDGQDRMVHLNQVFVTHSTSLANKAGIEVAHHVSDDSNSDSTGGMWFLELGITPKIAPAYDGTTSCFEYEQLVDGWCDITTLEETNRGTSRKRRLSGLATVQKEALDRDRRCSANGVKYFKKEMRPFFVKGEQYVLLWRFLGLGLFKVANLMDGPSTGCKDPTFARLQDQSEQAAYATSENGIAKVKTPTGGHIH